MSYAVRTRQDRFQTPCLILPARAAATGEEAILAAALEAVLELSGRLAEVVEDQPELDPDEPFFALVCEVAGPDGAPLATLEEEELFTRAAARPALRGLLERFLRDVIAYDLDPTTPRWAVHEEEEGGFQALRALLRADPRGGLPLWLEYLGAIDLERTATQYGLLREVAPRLEPAERVRLRDGLRPLSGSGDLVEHLQAIERELPR